MSNIDEHAVTARAPSSDAQTYTASALGHIKIVAPLEGRVNVKVSEGSLLKRGDLIAEQVSAKTELQVRAPESGYIRRVVGDGSILGQNDHIAELEVL